MSSPTEMLPPEITAFDLAAGAAGVLLDGMSAPPGSTPTPRPWRLSAFNSNGGEDADAGLSLRGFRDGATHWGAVVSGQANLMTEAGVFRVRSGMFFVAPGEAAVSPIEGIGAAGFVVSLSEYRGLFQLGGPIERTGRLKYIDGCSDTLLQCAARIGDPCFNHLHFPPGVRQTHHTHPSVRIGVIVRGRGICETPTRPVPLYPGLIWVLTPGGVHGFTTEDESLDVLVFHPDSDFGPSDEAHPMLNKTIVEGVSARELRADGKI